jgi:hypothetical protein
VKITINILSQKLFQVFTVTSCSVVVQAVTVVTKTIVTAQKIRALVGTVSIGSVALIDICYTDTQLICLKVPVS